jgi:hypothetical protein
MRNSIVQKKFNYDTTHLSSIVGMEGMEGIEGMEGMVMEGICIDCERRCSVDGSGGAGGGKCSALRHVAEQ